MENNIEYPGVYIEELPEHIKPIEGVPTSITAFLGRAEKGPGYKAERCLSHADFMNVYGAPLSDNELSDSVRLFFENGGTECYAVRLPGGGPDMAAALAALDDVDIFGLMVIPPDTTVSEAGRKAMLNAASEYCLRRRAFLLIDAPRSWPKNIDDAVVSGFRDQLVAESAAVFYPRIVLDAGKTSTVIGSTGAIAGMIARADAQQGVWKAPAGIELEMRGMIDLEQHLNDEENGKLNVLGVNCLRKFPTYGIVNWGARTLAGADGLGSEWKYIPVRRLTLFIEESVYRGTQWAVLEPNDEKLWQLITSSVFTFMLGLWKQGALFGDKPEEAFFISCNRTTITQDDIDQGRINIAIGMAAVKPAEFVVIYIQQIGLAAS
jgi:phage tail sheath protein FI